MSFGASSNSYQLVESVFAAYCTFKAVLRGFVANDDCKETRRCLPGLLCSIDLFDAMLGRVRTFPRGEL